MIKELEKPVLRRLFPDKSIVLEATDGTKTIASSKAVFKEWLDPEYNQFDFLQEPTAETELEIYEISADADFPKMFKSLSADLNLLHLTQHQITDYCLSYSNLLDYERGTFFLHRAKKDDLPVENAIAFVYSYPRGLRITHLPYDFRLTWHACGCHRLVIPAINKKKIGTKNY